MNPLISKQIIEDKKLLSHLKEHSYYIKNLNRDYIFFKEFQRQMKILYKERATDKIASALDGIDMISSIVDSVK